MKYILSLLMVLALLPAAHAQMGLNSPTGLAPRQDMEIYTRNGFLVQRKYRFTTADPNASINTLGCATSNPNLTAQAGVLKDPAGDGTYSANQYCTQSIFGSGSPSGYEIVFEDLDTEISVDRVTITDENGNTLVFSGGSSLPAPFFVTGESFNVRFESNSNGTVGRGFRLRWRAVFYDFSSPSPSVTAFGNALQFDAGKGALMSGQLPTGAVRSAGFYSTALGDRNTASGIASTALGLQNAASGIASTALGLQNAASGEGSTALGRNNTANGPFSTALGTHNRANGEASTALGDRNTASGDYSTVLGYFNTASGFGSTALGYQNTASGPFSTALGYQTTASGYASTALGYKVSTSGQVGSFIIGDFDPLAQGVTGIGTPDQFVARFRNGYYLMTSGNLNRTGVLIGAGQNAWGSISDSTRKERLLPINQADLLRKIGAMKLSTWNYKGQREIRHYGPMAQDFYAAFGHDGLGQVGCDTLIYSHDFAGVTFAGVQALIKENEQLKAKLSQTEANLNQTKADLEQAKTSTNARLEAIEAMLIPRRRGSVAARK